MKKILALLFAPLLAFAQTNIQKVGGGNNTISNGSIVVGNSTSITATGNGTIIATGGVASSLPWAGLTAIPTPTLSHTGDVTGSITLLAGGSATGALTLATVNANVGTFASVTVNGKGLVTAAANLSGDITTSGSVATLATVATGATTGSSTAIPVITFNNKGLVTAVTTAAVVAPAGTLTGTILASNVVTSSLTSVGTLISLVVSGTSSGASESITGTAGAGFLQIANQSSAPSTPTTAGRLYWDSTNRLSWKGTNGFVRTFDGTANTADRIYVLPDVAGTIALVGSTVASITGTAGQITASASTGAVTLSIPSAVTGINSITSAAGSTLALVSLDTNENITATPNGTGTFLLKGTPNGSANYAAVTWGDAGLFTLSSRNAGGYAVGYLAYNFGSNAAFPVYAKAFETDFNHTFETYESYTSPTGVTTDSRWYQANISNTAAGGGGAIGYATIGFSANQFGVGVGTYSAGTNSWLQQPFNNNFLIDFTATPHPLTFDGIITLSFNSSGGKNTSKRGWDLGTQTTWVTTADARISEQSDTNGALELNAVAGHALLTFGVAGTYLGNVLTESSNTILRLTAGTSMALRLAGGDSDNGLLISTAGAGTLTGALTVSSSTASTSTTTGSGIFGGGLGVAGATYIGAGLVVNNGTTFVGASAALISESAGGNNNALEVNAANGHGLLRFGTGATFQGNVSTESAGSILRVNAGTSMSLRLTGGDSDNGLLISTAGAGTLTGALTISSATEATTGGAGSLISSGGFYATKAIISGSATASTTTSTGGIIGAGGLGLAGAINGGTYLSMGTAALLTGTGDIAGSGWTQNGAPTGGTAAKHKIGALVTGLTLSLLAADGIEYEAADGTKLYLLVATRP